MYASNYAVHTLVSNTIWIMVNLAQSRARKFLRAPAPPSLEESRKFFVKVVREFQSFYMHVHVNNEYIPECLRTE